jgi:hypothetical protein
MDLRRLLIVAILIGCIATPAMAGEKYLYGSPELTASIAGTNEFSPGDDLMLPVMLENTGLNDIKIVQSTIINRDDLPNTAKMVTVTLDPTDGPLSVKSDPQMVGDISGGSSTIVNIHVKFSRGATPGSYTVPLLVDYTYLSSAEQYGSDMISYNYRTEQETIPLLLKMKSDVSIDVEDLDTDSLNVGTEGYLTLTLKNTGFENAKKAVVRIAQNGASPIVPTDGSVFIGSFGPGELKECTFKAAVSSDAEEQTYPLDVYLEYEDSDGDVVSSGTETVGVPVGGKIDFEVISAPPTVYAGEKTVIEVVYRNSGSATVYNAQARISAVDPFSSNDDTAFLGHVAPGDTVTARFEMSVDASGTVKSYGLDSEIRYRDALDNSQISDTLKVEIGILERSGVMTMLSNPILLSVIAILIIGAGYYLWSHRKEE